MKGLHKILFILSMVMLMCGCMSMTAGATGSVSITGKRTEMPIGKSITLTAKSDVKKNGKTVGIKSVSWKSSNTGVATVTKGTIVNDLNKFTLTNIQSCDTLFCRGALHEQTQI